MGLDAKAHNTDFPPVGKNIKIPKSITDHNQTKKTEKTYQSTAEDVKYILKSLDDRVGDDRLDGLDHVEVEGDDAIHIDETKTYTATPNAIVFIDGGSPNASIWDTEINDWSSSARADNN